MPRLVMSERKLFIRERLAGYYSELSYLTSKILTDVLPIRMASGLLLVSVAYWISDLNHDYFVFIKFLIAVSLTQMVSIMICLFFSAAFKNYSEANLVAAVFFIFSIIFGGYFVNGKSTSTFFKYVSFLFYGFEALFVNEMADISITIGAAGYSVSGIKGYIITDAFGLGRFIPVYPRDIGILVIWVMFFFLATLIALKTRQI
jgi:ATP-binding cassette subfamily G (WHITE) protein 2